MKVTNFHLRVAILVLAGILITYGVLKILFKFQLGDLVDQNLPTVVMLGAAGIFLWNRQIWNQEKKREAEEEAKKLDAEQAAATEPKKDE
jgi:hypothetical protein